LKTYVGIKENAKSVIFELDTEPTKETLPQIMSFMVPSSRRRTPKNMSKQWVTLLAERAKKV
jgi:hypothetical protein